LATQSKAAVAVTPEFFERAVGAPHEDRGEQSVVILAAPEDAEDQLLPVANPWSYPLMAREILVEMKVSSSCSGSVRGWSPVMRRSCGRCRRSECEQDQGRECLSGPPLVKSDQQALPCSSSAHLGALAQVFASSSAGGYGVSRQSARLMYAANSVLTVSELSLGRGS
jgi:hypothetical protein